VSSDQEFVELATARGPALFRTAWLLTGDFHLAEDLVQEALGRIYARWSKVAAADQPAAYAHTVLVHAFLSHRRRRSSTERPSDTSGPAGLGDRAGADDDVALRVALLTALGHLDRLDRAVVVLRYWDDLDAPATAALVGLSPAAVRTRCSRALARLRAVLGDDLADLLAR
jgi:RNA polymerase sigma-70 factor (sigma-E family)